MGRHWGAYVMTVAAAATAMSGCAPTDCSDVGAESGISVTLSGPEVTVGDTVRVCVDNECAEAPIVDTEAPIFVANNKVDSQAEVAVVLSVSSPGKDPIVPPTEYRIRPQRIQPNGPGCDPVAYVGAVSASASP